MKQKHQPVLLANVLQLLEPAPGDSYFDGTAGYGGHAAAILERIGPEGRAVLADRDRQAIKALGQKFGERAELLHCSYNDAADRLLQDGTLVDLILLDLGVSSPQLDEGERGFSFQADGPLDMRMDDSQELTAAAIVNGYPEKRLAELMANYGEERRARAVARAIVANRPLSTTSQLAKLVRSVVGRSKDKIDPATRTFQALRIEVNNELEELEQALPKLLQLLLPNGRIAVISFHSLEDRVVKQFFQQESRDCICPPSQPVCTCNHVASLKLLTRKPISGQQEDAFNPRARSAKLRAAVKINKNKKEVA